MSDERKGQRPDGQPGSFDDMLKAWLGLDEPPLPLPDLVLTPAEVAAWKEAFEKARCAIGDGPFDAVEMIQEQRR